MSSEITSTESRKTWLSYVRMFFVRFGRDLGYLLPLGPIAVVSFSILLTLALASLGTVVVWVGVPLGVGTLCLSRWFATLERARLRPLTDAKLASFYLPGQGGTASRRLLGVLKDGQLWRDLAYAVVTFPVSILSWSITVSWLALALGGTTAVIWDRWTNLDSRPQSGILAWLTSTQGATVMGVIALATLPWVVRGLATLHLGLGSLLLTPGDEMALRAKVAKLERATRAAAAAEAGALRRLERDVHDGPQQQLVRLAMDVQRAENNVDTNPAAVREALVSARELAAQALTELRALTRGIAPPLLADRGLVAAISSLAERSTVPVDVLCGVSGTFPIGVETTAYFVVAESLTNVAKHADAHHASVTVDMREGIMIVRITDDGTGGAHIAKGQGLAGLEQRVEGAGGTLTVSDAAGGGTVVTAEVPCG